MWVTQWIKNWLDLCSHRVEVSGLMSTWRPVRSGVPEALVLGPVLDKDSGMEGTLSKFATDTKLCHVDNKPEGRDAILRDPV